MSELKLSEAIRLGATMRPQAFGMRFDGRGTCAIGAAMEAAGRLCKVVLSGTGFKAVDEFLVFLECPAPECGLKVYGLGCLIVHLNDDHRLSRERIADFVELHEALPEPSVVSPELVEVQPCLK